MPKIKLTKTTVDAATPKDRDYELQDTIIPGSLVKITPTGRKIFMIAYAAHNGQRRKPAIGRYGAITVEQARRETGGVVDLLLAITLPGTHVLPVLRHDFATHKTAAERDQLLIECRRRE